MNKINLDAIQVNYTQKSNHKSKNLVTLFFIIGLFFFSTTLFTTTTISATPTNPQSIYLYKASQLQVGDYIADFGNFNGHSLRWRVIKKDDQGVMLRTEYLLSNQDGSALPIFYDDITSNPNAKINEAVRRGDVTQYRTRNDYGTNYYEQSTIRTYLNQTFIQSFTNAQSQAIVTSPKVPVLLAWPDVMSTWDTNKVEFEDGISFNHNSTVIRNVQLAQDYSGKQTYFPNSNGKLIYATSESSNLSSLESLKTQAQQSAYYFPEDSIFFAPTDLIIELGQQSIIKNPKGDTLIKIFSYNNATSAYWSGNPDITPERREEGTQSLTAAQIYVASGTIAARNAYSQGLTASLAPSIYLKNDTVLRKGTQVSVPNETGQYYSYTLSDITPIDPNITTPTLTNATYNTPYTQKIDLNTDDVEVSLTSGTLPQGLSFDPETLTLSGTPQQIGTFNITFQATNNFNTSIKPFNLIVGKAASPLPDNSNTPQNIVVTIGSGVEAINEQLPSAWRYIGQQDIVFDVENEVQQLPFVYNPDTNLYFDTPQILLNVTTSARTPHAPPSADSIPQNLIARVGQPLSQTQLNDGTTQPPLPPYFAFIDPNATPTTVGNFSVRLKYNTNEVQHLDYYLTITLQVQPGQAKQPPSIPTLTAEINQTTQDILDQLPSGWFFTQSQTFNQSGSIPVDLIYNPERIDPNNIPNYDDYTTTLKVEVAKLRQPAPPNLPPIPNILRFGESISTSIELPENFTIKAFNNENQEINNDAKFDKQDNLRLRLYYNQDPDTYLSWESPQEYYIQILRRPAVEVDTSIFANFEMIVNRPAKDYQNKLPLNFWFEDPEQKFSRTGTAPIRIFYNPDEALYEDTIIDLEIKIIPVPVEDTVFGSVWIFILSAVAGAAILFGGTYLIIRSQKKKNAKVKVSPILRPQNYGQTQQSPYHRPYTHQNPYPPQNPTSLTPPNNQPRQNPNDPYNPYNRR